MIPMNNSQQELADPDDFFAETRMSFGEHIEDLRTHLIRAIKGFLIALFVSFFLAKHVLAFIRAPVERQLIAFWDRYNTAKMQEALENPAEANVGSQSLLMRIDKRDLRSAMGFPRNDEDMAGVLRKMGITEKQPPVFNPFPTFEVLFDQLGISDVIDSRKYQDQSAFSDVTIRIGKGDDWAFTMEKLKQRFRPPVLTVLSVTEGFAVWAKVAIITGFVIGSPWIFYQLWMFVAAGLYPHEKKYVNVYLPFSLGLFLGGVFLCEFFVMDKAIEALLWFNEFLGLVPELRLSEWLGFAIFMPLVFGLAFQTPLVMLFIQRVGVVKTEAFRKHWRIVWFLMAVFAAVITPSTDPVSMLLLWVPMVLLYELGIYLCKIFPGTPLLDFDVPESEEMIEV
jgi:sec-independent protein translocase protein TatC